MESKDSILRQRQLSAAGPSLASPSTSGPSAAGSSTSAAGPSTSAAGLDTIDQKPHYTIEKLEDYLQEANSVNAPTTVISRAAITMYLSFDSTKNDNLWLVLLQTITSLLLVLSTVGIVLLNTHIIPALQAHIRKIRAHPSAQGATSGKKLWHAARLYENDSRRLCRVLKCTRFMGTYVTFLILAFSLASTSIIKYWNIPVVAAALIIIQIIISVVIYAAVIIITAY